MIANRTFRTVGIAGLIAAGMALSVGTAAAAGFDCSKWQRADDGTWTAKEPVQIGGNAGRLDYMPGEVYRAGQQKNGLDIVKLLDANCKK